jgi:hypothetical protein
MDSPCDKHYVVSSVLILGFADRPVGTQSAQRKSMQLISYQIGKSGVLCGGKRKNRDSRFESQRHLALVVSLVAIAQIPNIPS